MARGKSIKDQQYSNWKPGLIQASTTRGTDDFPNPHLNPKNDDVCYLNVSVKIKNFGEEEPDFVFLKLTFINSERGNIADTIMDNFGDGGPFSGGGVPLTVVPGPLTIREFEGKLGTKNKPVTITLGSGDDAEEISSEEERIKGPNISYEMIPQSVAIPLDTVAFGDDTTFRSIFWDNGDNDGDDDGDKPRRNKPSSSSNRRNASKRKKKDEEDAEEPTDDTANEPEEEDDSSDDSGDGDGGDDDAKPRGRSARRGRSNRSSSSRRRRSS